MSMNKYLKLCQVDNSGQERRRGAQRAQPQLKFIHGESPSHGGIVITEKDRHHEEWDERNRRHGRHNVLRAHGQLCMRHVDRDGWKRHRQYLARVERSALQQTLQPEAVDSSREDQKVDNDLGVGAQPHRRKHEHSQGYPHHLKLKDHIPQQQALIFCLALDVEEEARGCE